ncbi:tetratricopeptide repeat protein [Leptolyngbya sp. DQ-M1]|uniref:tetratricopeptide repeat protein n=1 Tax=Leptolyngbya sp. DQ-M1 TaxID=2933920 RepID=UPI003296A6A7
MNGGLQARSTSKSPIHGGLRGLPRFNTVANPFCTTLLSLAVIAGTAQVSVAQSAADYRQRGIQYRNQEQFESAIAAFEKAVELDPKNLAGRIGLGWTLHLANRRPEAIGMLQSAILYNPFNIETFNALGIAYLVNGDLSQAVATHTWATMLNPNNEIPYYNLSLSYERLAMYDWSIECAKRAAELEPNNPHPWIALAIAYQGQGDKVSAQQIFQQAITVDPRYGDRSSLTYLARAGFTSEQIKTAQQLLAAK